MRNLEELVYSIRKDKLRDAYVKCCEEYIELDYDDDYTDYSIKLCDKVSFLTSLVGCCGYEKEFITKRYSSLEEVNNSVGLTLIAIWLNKLHMVKYSDNVLEAIEKYTQILKALYYSAGSDLYIGLNTQDSVIIKTTNNDSGCNSIVIKLNYDANAMMKEVVYGIAACHLGVTLEKAIQFVNSNGKNISISIKDLI